MLCDERAKYVRNRRNSGEILGAEIPRVPESENLLSCVPSEVQSVGKAIALPIVNGHKA